MPVAVRIFPRVTPPMPRELVASDVQSEQAGLVKMGREKRSGAPPPSGSSRQSRQHRVLTDTIDIIAPSPGTELCRHHVLAVTAGAVVPFPAGQTGPGNETLDVLTEMQLSYLLKVNCESRQRTQQENYENDQKINTA